MNPTFILVPSVAPMTSPSKEGVIILLKLHFSSSTIAGGQWLWGRVVRASGSRWLICQSKRPVQGDVI